jgi:predicted membrane-bound dolichyl-phosphate-mannose-protein mannosyltransferase
LGGDYSSFVTQQPGQVLTRNPLIDFRGAVNPVLLGPAIIAALFVALHALKSESRITVWCTVWLAANYVPYVALVLVNHRVTYLFYFLPVIPALAVAVATLLLRSGLSHTLAKAYVAAYLLGFAAYFPFRQIL